VFASQADPDALVALLSPDDSTYQSNSSFVWHLLRDAGFDLPYADTIDLPTAYGLRLERTANIGDLALYYRAACRTTSPWSSRTTASSRDAQRRPPPLAVRRVRRRDPLPPPVSDADLRRRRRRPADTKPPRSPTLARPVPP
jgi:hypothetical protein